MPAYSGKTGYLAIDGVSLPLTSWSIKVSNELEDVSNADDGAFVVTRSNISGSEISAEGFWTGETGLVDGSTHTFTLGVSASGPFFIVTATIREMELSQDVKGVAKFRLSAQSEGQYTTQF